MWVKIRPNRKLPPWGMVSGVRLEDYRRLREGQAVNIAQKAAKFLLAKGRVEKVELPKWKEEKKEVKKND